MSTFSWPPEWAGSERMQLGHCKVNPPVYMRVTACTDRNFASPLSLIHSPPPFWAVGTEITWQLFAIVINLEIIQWALVGSQGFWQLPEASAILWCYKSSWPCAATLAPEQRQEECPSPGTWEETSALPVPPPFHCHLIVWGIGRTINKRD